jgi:multiple sugar transport system substrate-binding protein
MSIRHGGIAKTSRSDIVPKIPGPKQWQRDMTKDEMLRIIDFVEASRNPHAQLTCLQTADPVWRMLLMLIRRHLEGKPVTITSLAASSDVPYATAMRRIDELLAQGIILRRARTRTGRSFSIHPAEKLLDDFQVFAQQIKRLVARTFGLSSAADRDSEAGPEFYFGGAYMAARVIPAPSIMPNGLRIGETLRILTHTDPTFMAMEQVAPALRQSLGGGIHFAAFDLDALHSATLENGRKHVSDYDILGVDLPWIGEFATAGILLPLDDAIAESGFTHSDFHPAGWEAARYGGHQYGIPMQTTPELLFYRTDKFAAAGLHPPVSTEDVLDAGRALHHPSRGMCGIAWNGRRGTPIGHTFMQVMAAFGQPLLNLRPVGHDFDAAEMLEEHRRPCLASDAAMQAAEYLLDLLPISAPDVLNMQWNDRIRAYREGRVAMTYGWTGRASAFELDPRSPARGKTGYAPHPRGPAGRNISPIGGLVLSIPTNLGPDRRDLAWRAIRWLTSPEIMKMFVQNGSVVSPRFSVSADPEVRSAFPIIASVDRMAQLGQLQLWPRPPVPEFNAIIAILGEHVHDMMQGLITPKIALSLCQVDIERCLSSG